MSAAELVSVVVPSYNAAKTLDETLRSVRAQSHWMLDIIVVDDGSTDATAEVAQRHVEADSRVRLLRQANGGVAKARNTGWRAARAKLIALVDSDDLWAPTKIELQLEALRAGGPQVGLVYCFFTHIDAQSMAAPLWEPEPCSGDVLDRILAHNFVGNGSSMLVRQDVLLACDGFDETLREAGAQGCDDYLFCCRAAEICHFACVPAPLVGYRETPGSISSHVRRMLHSWILVTDQMLARHPARRAIILRGLRGYADFLLGRAIDRRRWDLVRQIWGLLIRHYPGLALRVIGGFPLDFGLRLARRTKGRIAGKLRPQQAVARSRYRFPVGTLPTAETIR